MTKMLLALLVLLAGFATPDQPPEPPPDRDPCAVATEPCIGTVQVPLNHADPTSERIEVAFQRIPRRDLSTPATGVVLAHLGGLPDPWVRSPELLRAALIDPLGPVFDHQDLVTFDMRGLARSAPLGCTGLDVDRPETAAGCGEQLGPRAAWFALDQVPEDLDAVRAALGVDRWTLFGNSWGTRPALAYAARFPERTAAVLINGALSVTPDGYSNPGGPYASLASARLLLERDCAAVPECAALPGSTTDRLTLAAEVMRAAGEPVDRLVAAMEETPFVPRFARDMNAALQARIDGDPAPLRRLLDAAPPPFDRPEIPPAQAAALLTYSCSAGQLPFDRTAPPAERRAQLADFYATEQPFAPFTQAEAEAGSVLANTFELCSYWPWLRDTAPHPAVGGPRPDMPVLQIAGDADPTTVDAEALDDRFARHTLVRVPGGEHQAWDDEHPVDGWCVRDVARAFLLDPNAPVHADCDRNTLHPLGAFPRTAGQLEPATLLNAAFATAVDATVPRHPTDPPAAPEFTQPGVRGGTATGNADGSVTLAGYRFVEDVTVDGTITIAPDHTATAVLTATTADGPHPVRFSWPLLDPTPTAT